MLRNTEYSDMTKSQINFASIQAKRMQRLTLQLCPLYGAVEATVDHEHTKACHHRSCCHLEMAWKYEVRGRQEGTNTA